jgi:hypothetical protein
MATTSWLKVLCIFITTSITGFDEEEWIKNKKTQEYAVSIE